MKFTKSLRTSLYTTVGALLLTLSSFAQAPEKMSYQAVIRGANNALVTNQQVGMQISILQGSTAVYEETQTPTSNTNGLVSLEIGTGTVISGSFAAIDWSADTYFIKTETDPTGGTNYTITGTSQLLSVPFALYATTSGDGITTDQSDAIVLNTAKVGVTSAQANEIVANTTKVGITTDQSDAIVLNTAKTGITSVQSDAIVANTAKVVITSAQANEIVANTAKTGITSVQSDAIVANTAKVVITSAQANEIVANTAKYSKNEVDALIANLQSQINNLVVGFGVGDFYGGGVVFYIFESGDTGYVAGETHGLIAAVQDQSSGIRWYNGSNTRTWATATTIGTGSANTDAIIAVQGATETSYAAGLARAYTGGGFTDWFLPSIDELAQMYTNKATINTTASANGGSNFANAYYWSSTESGISSAWYKNLNHGYQSDGSKYGEKDVRAVRAF